MFEINGEYEFFIIRCLVQELQQRIKRVIDVWVIEKVKKSNFKQSIMTNKSSPMIKKLKTNKLKINK